MIRPIRWGIIGIGRFGRIHAHALRAVSGVQLIAITRRDGVKLDEAARELNVRRKYPDFHELLSDPDIDAVTICTHWEDHHDVALAALRERQTCAVGKADGCYEPAVSIAA